MNRSGRGWIVLLILLIGGAAALAAIMTLRHQRAAQDARVARVLAARSAPAPPVPPDVRARRVELLEELRTVTLSNCALARVGRANDGGYLMCRNLMSGLETAYSYGIGLEDAWGCEISSTFGVPVHQYDCFSPRPVRCARGTLTLNAECVGPAAAVIDGRPFDTVANHVTRNGDVGRKMVVKMDVEGAEWQSVLATPDAVLAGIDQMAMELHGIDAPGMLEGLRKLKTHFYLVSVHFNNQACTSAAAPLPGSAFQVLFVNKRIGALGPPAGGVRPEALLTPDDPTLPDCQLPASALVSGPPAGPA